MKKITAFILAVLLAVPALAMLRTTEFTSPLK